MIYGSTSYDSDRIDFEVTFMTKSYFDDKITIPASANKNMRRPRSMVLRKDKPDIYKNTITASIYNSEQPSCIIVSDTNDTRSQYHELYPDQKSRIKSSIINPVLSSNNRMLGAIVVHCDKRDFFKEEERKFWIDYIEVFSKSIGAEKINLDIIYEHFSNKDASYIEKNESKFF